MFDPNDAAQADHILTASNFYFDHIESTTQQPEYDFYFTGVHDPSRARSINIFARYAAENKYTVDLNILWKYASQRGRQHYPEANIKLIQNGLDFAENLQRAAKARVLIDFVSSDHSGLSFRTFEALGNNQKLITTNAAVKGYDFYHPDNILVWNGRDLSGLADFLARPYQPVDGAIKHKYGFANWLNYVLDIEPYQSITLP